MKGSQTIAGSDRRLATNEDHDLEMHAFLRERMQLSTCPCLRNILLVCVVEERVNLLDLVPPNSASGEVMESRDELIDS
jgi:hypothetical protein